MVMLWQKALTIFSINSFLLGEPLAKIIYFPFKLCITGCSIVVQINLNYLVSKISISTIMIKINILIYRGYNW